MQRILQFGFRPVRTDPACADAAVLQLPDLLFHFLEGLSHHVPYQGVRVSLLPVDSLRGGHQHQQLCLDQSRDDRGGLVVVHALMHFAAHLAPGRQFHLPVFIVGYRVVVVDDRDGLLLCRADQQLFDMLPLFRVVEVGMLAQDLAQAVFRPEELPVVLHQDGLALGGIVSLVLFRIAAQLVSRPLDIVQAADFRGAASHPDHTGFQVRPEPGDDVVVDLLILFPDQRHASDLAHQVKLIFHILLSSAGQNRSVTSRLSV